VNANAIAMERKREDAATIVQKHWRCRYARQMTTKLRTEHIVRKQVSCRARPHADSDANSVLIVSLPSAIGLKTTWGRCEASMGSARLSIFCSSGCSASMPR
jgi:hypothetical protein